MKPVQIGITGGIGSGKSIVCRILEETGIPVFNADSASKLLLDSDPEIVAAVKGIFGDTAYHSKGGANRAFIAKMVFDDPEKLKALNALLHPAVHKSYQEWVNRHSNFPLLAKEAAIMFESGSHKDLDYVVVVTAPEQMRIKRVIARDGKTAEEVQKIINQQLPQEAVVKQSNFEIVNDESCLVIPQVLSIIEKINLNR